jgi:hypothetical protein
METADPQDDGITLGRRFIDAIVARDWDGLAACFDPDVRFTAVVPKDNAFRDRHGAEEAARQLKAWFGDADITELVTSEVDAVKDRVKIAYRIHEHEPDGWYLVEQIAYATAGERGFRYMNLACSGFRPVTE